jgi:hypothetical protein
MDSQSPSWAWGHEVVKTKCKRSKPKFPRLPQQNPNITPGHGPATRVFMNRCSEARQRRHRVHHDRCSGVTG